MTTTIAVAGKGGTGKTTVCGMIIRYLTQQGLGPVLAIDAVACLVDGLGERLGDDYSTMRDALNNIRLAFVQIKGQVAATVESSEPTLD